MTERWPENCDRCGADLARTASTMSKFNADVICVACKADERLAPGYQAADDTEVAMVRAGVRNYSGVGLSPTDAAFLATRRAARAKVQVAP